MTPYERYLTRQALAVEIERVEIACGYGTRVIFRPKQPPPEITRLQSIKESEWAARSKNAE